MTNEFGIEWMRRHLGPDYRIHVLDFKVKLASGLSTSACVAHHRRLKRILDTPDRLYVLCNTHVELLTPHSEFTRFYPPPCDLRGYSNVGSTSDRAGQSLGEELHE